MNEKNITNWNREKVNNVFFQWIKILSFLSLRIFMLDELKPQWHILPVCLIWIYIYIYIYIYLQADFIINSSTPAFVTMYSSFYAYYISVQYWDGKEQVLLQLHQYIYVTIFIRWILIDPHTQSVEKIMSLLVLKMFLNSEALETEHIVQNFPCFFFLFFFFKFLLFMAVTISRLYYLQTKNLRPKKRADLFRLGSLLTYA